MSGSLTIASPAGPLRLTAENGELVEIRFLGGPEALLPPEPPSAAGDEREIELLRETRAQLDAYFEGTLREFDLPLAPRGTPFQLRVWDALLEIPYGETWSYSDVARRIGSPTSTRAVGAANGDNPLPIVIPCHRVIGADGSLTGYGGGLDVKRHLLRLEGSLRAPTLFDLD